MNKLTRDKKRADKSNYLVNLYLVTRQLNGKYLINSYLVTCQLKNKKQ